MPQEEITPSDIHAFINSGKIPNAPINNGPWVYDLTQVPSRNAIDPFYYAQEGVVSKSTRETP